MTIKDLIEELSKHDQKTEVFMDFGLGPFSISKEVEIREDMECVEYLILKQES
jgi:hypothetical protein